MFLHKWLVELCSEGWEEWLTSARGRVGQSLSLSNVRGRSHGTDDWHGLANNGGGGQLAGDGGGVGHDGGESLGAGYCAWVSQSVAENNVSVYLLTNISRGDSGVYRGSCRLVCRVYGADDSRRGRSPGRRLVLGSGYDAGDRLGRSLCDSRVDCRACGRCPRHGVAAVSSWAVLHWRITSELGGRNDVGARSEDRQYVESELHLDVNVQCEFWECMERDN
jgi:hypothetical protein